MKNDQRVSRSQKLLKLALIELLKEKSLDHITVKEIVERAELNRSTFYINFYDKQDLFFQTSESLIKEFQRVLVEGLPRDQEYESMVESIMEKKKPFETFPDMFQHFSRYAKFYEVLLKNQDFEKRLIEVMKQAAPLILAAEPGISFLCIRFLTLVKWWLDQGMPYSISHISLLASKLVIMDFALLSSKKITHSPDLECLGL